LERSISNRFYLDYNATSPLSIKVQNFLRSGDFLFGNPASLHTTGKNSKKFISETSDYLFKLFSLSRNDFKLVYHSGATEGINSYFKGNALLSFKNNEKALFVFSSVDHQAAISLENDLKLLNHDVYYFDVDKNGDFDVEKLIAELNIKKKNYKKIFFNYTYINNETGVVWPLELAVKIKHESGAYVHVDAVQLIGKKINWDILNNELDAYVFSAHKFGALKGIGFSFYKSSSPYYPLITGGNQQDNYRSGTENSLGIYSIKLALMEMVENFNPDVLRANKSLLEDVILKKIANNGEVVSIHARQRNLNTIFFIMYNQKAESLSMKFDMNSMDVSTGSACSSGIIKENRIVKKMGYSAEESKNCIRISLSSTITKEEVEQIALRVQSII
jgi:cysteine desulfurase